jgi:hypothetical protein
MTTFAEELPQLVQARGDGIDPILTKHDGDELEIPSGVGD